MTTTGTPDSGAPRVGIIMGSDSDLPVMQAAADALDELRVPYELTIVSAHRTPRPLYDSAAQAAGRGIDVIIAGVGGAAHLPGMVAAISPLPVIGVPVKSRALGGEDSLLSIVQMPAGVPVATVAIDGARNAGLLAVQIIAIAEPALRERIVDVGGFAGDARIELLNGEIVTLSPQKSAHATAVGLVEEALRRRIAADCHIRSQKPLALDERSEPEPDIAVVPGRLRDYAQHYPSTALLIVEVADSSLAFDRTSMAQAYARNCLL